MELNVTKPIIFISHTHKDAALAQLLQKALEASLRLEDDQIFCSSSDDFLPNYMVDIATQIKDGLLETSAAFILLTPFSMQSHWIMFEAGAINVRGQMIIPVLTPELSYKDLPGPLQGRQCIQTLESGNSPSIKLDNAMRSISKQFGFQERTGGGRRVAIDTFIDSCRNWADLADRAGNDIELLYLTKEGELEQILCAPRINGSPFDFISLVKRAKEQLFIAGQNLYFLTCGPQSDFFKQTVMNFVMLGKKMRFMICDPGFKPHIPTWSAAVNAEGYESTLLDSVESFKKWKQDIPGLEVRLTKFIPTSMTFLDPDSQENDGFLVFTPHAFRPETALRPCFGMSRRRHKLVFDEFWNYYQQTWIDQGGRTRPL